MREMLLLGLACLMLGLVTTALFAAEKKPTGLTVGQTVPPFQATDDQGQPWKSSDHVGKKTLVVFFFPADFTGG